MAVVCIERTDTSIGSDDELLEIALRATESTLCLTSALARHGLSDVIPDRIDVALPRGHRHPQTQAPVTWHSFAVETFHVGREELPLEGGVAMGLYNAERCIIDAFRLRHSEGPEVAYEALRRWLRSPGTQPSRLLAMARSFPKAEPAMRLAWRSCCERPGAGSRPVASGQPVRQRRVAPTLTCRTWPAASKAYR